MRNEIVSQIQGWVGDLAADPSFDGIDGLGAAGIAASETAMQQLLRQLEAHLGLSYVAAPYIEAFGAKGVEHFRKMLRFVIANWRNPQTRIVALERMAGVEAELVPNGMMGDIGAIAGIAGEDGSPIGFFKALKKITKKVGSGIKNASKGAFNVFKKINPLFIGWRQLMLLRLRKNWGKVSSKLRYGYITDKSRAMEFTDEAGWEKAKSEVAKIERNFKGWGGNPANIKKAILDNGRGNGISGIEAYPETLEGVSGTGDEMQGKFIGLGIVSDAIAIFKDLFNGIKFIFSKKAEDQTPETQPDASDKSVQAEVGPASNDGGSPAASGGEGEGSDKTFGGSNPNADESAAKEGFLKKHQTKIIVGGIAALALGVGGFFVFRK